MDSGVIVNIDDKCYYCEYLLCRMSYMEHHRFMAEFVADSSIAPNSLCRKQITFIVTDINGHNYNFGGVVISSSCIEKYGIPCRVKIEGGAPTLLMDMEKGNNSYTDTTVSGIVDDVLNNYVDILKYKLQGAESIIKMFEKRVGYRARYNETEWAFLMHLLKESNIPVWYSGKELIIGSSSNGGKSIELSFPIDFLYYEPVYTDKGLGRCVMELHNPVLQIGDSIVVESKDGVSPKLRVIAKTLTFKDRSLKAVYEAVPSKKANKNLYKTGNILFAGFQVGKVIRNDDPKYLGRVMVQLKWHKEVDETKSTNWIDVMRPYAGFYSGELQNRGFFFIPEVGDNVVVSYFENDMNRPVVCSTIYADGAARWDDDSNNIKSFSTKSGHRIVFDDSDNGGIEISDRVGNMMKMESNSGSITLLSPQRITVSAKEIELSGSKVCEMESEALVKIKSGKEVFIASAGENKITSDNSITVIAEDELAIECKGELSIEHNTAGRWYGRGKIDIKSGERVNIAKI